jgi:hypothetical protein
MVRKGLTSLCQGAMSVALWKAGRKGEEPKKLRIYNTTPKSG